MRWLRHAWAAVWARVLHDRDLCLWCRQYLPLDDEPPAYTYLGEVVHAACLDAAGHDVPPTGR